MATSSTESLRSRLDAATARFDILEHPFYRAWADGSLTRSDLGHYAEQYRHHVAAFTGYLEKLAERVGGSARDALLENLSDERDGDHLGLWERFASAAGASAAEPSSETNACIDAFARACEERPPAFALGMIYGYESQTPRVAATKLEGLRESYGFRDEDAAYFELHATLDVEHSRSLADAIGTFATDPRELELAEEGAAAGAAAVWKLLDGVERERAPA